uniref:Integrin alpha-2 domain-containing protein n=1 Tax=Leptobrachium leishanense TaxID=445787 RepID=A0A8C5R204_9ANUR
MTNDGLPDLTVGSEGKVLVMKTRPVIGVSFSMRFEPAEIRLSVFECPDPKELGKDLSFQLCINTNKKTPLYKDRISARLMYTVTLDSGRTQIRARFKDGGQSQNKAVTVTEGNVCSEHTYQLPECVEDSLSPLTVTLNFSLSGTPVLSEDSPSRHVGQVKFQKNCGSDVQCQDDLRITSFLDSEGTAQLVVGVSLEVNLTIAVQNHGEDSYNSRVVISYPAGLSYRKVTLAQSNKRVSVSCNPLDEAKQVTCDVNKPLLRPNTTAIFVVSFHVSSTADLGDTLSMMANITSDNNDTITDVMRSSARLNVLYGIYVTITSLEESTRHTNFSSRETSDKSSTRYVQHVYKVNNLGQRALPLSVFFMIPVKLKDDPLWEKVEIKSSELGLSNCMVTTHVPAPKNSEDILKTRPVLDCTVATCTYFTCNVSNMEVRTAITFTMSGQVTGQWSQQTQQTKLSLQSEAQILYNTRRYRHILEQNERFVRAQVQARCPPPPGSAGFTEDTNKTGPGRKVSQKWQIYWKGMVPFWSYRSLCQPEECSRRAETSPEFSNKTAGVGRVHAHVHFC